MNDHCKCRLADAGARFEHPVVNHHSRVGTGRQRSSLLTGTVWSCLVTTERCDARSDTALSCAVAFPIANTVCHTVLCDT